MRLRKNTFTATLILLVAASVWLLVQFSAPVLNLQLSLWRGRWLLLIWRLVLYGLTAGLWFTLSSRLQQHNPAAFHHLKRAAGWSLLLLVAGEISNILQWGEM
ncbi:hypothetical protein B4R02_21695 [Salmonella enterica]|uniref:hypothetical protein n=1 Tax=Citrobacter werkmanii TaxID=67827 RepID=UPI0012CD44CA|nr:hypothetical protein [Salmonella enterica subsp. diarizonae serovar 42:l,v:1,5,7]ECU9385540.1 hypothetical protein [Salmonella enterica subsp. enterica serovar Newport]